MLALATLALGLCPLQRAPVEAPEPACELRLEGVVAERPEDARVRATVRYAGDVRYETVARTDAEGRFVLELPTRDALGVEGDYLSATIHVDEAGYQRSFVKLYLPARPKTLKPVRLPLRAGATARVVLTDERGERTDGKVIVFGLGSWSLEGLPVEVPRTLGSLAPDRLDRGLYELHFDGAPVVDVLAVSSLGSGFLPGVRLEPGRRDQVLSVVVERGRSLGGTLRASDGRPLAGVKIRAWPFELVGEDRPREAFWRRPELRRSWGCTLGSVLTDADGRFEVSGLQAGDYFLETDELLPVPRTPFAAGDTSIDLRADLHRIVVEVRDATGAPSATGTPTCWRLPSEGTQGAPRRLELDAQARREGRHEAHVRPGHDYVVSLFDPALGHDERTVHVARGRTTTRVVLQMNDRPPAELAVIVPPPPPGAEDDEVTYVDVLSAAHGFLVHSSAPKGLGLLSEPRAGVRREGDATVLTLPAGEYVVRARPAQESEWLYDGWTRLTRGPVEQGIELSAGERRTLRLAPWVGGHVELSFSDRGGAEFVRHPTSHGCWLECRGENFGFSAVEAGGEGRRPPELRFDFRGEEAGTVFRSVDPLRPGRRILRIEARGFEPVTVEALVEEGGTTRVEVVLDARE